MEALCLLGTAVNAPERPTPAVLPTAYRHSIHGTVRLTTVEARVHNAERGGTPGGGNARGHEVGHGWQHHALAEAHCSAGQQHHRQRPSSRNNLNSCPSSGFVLVLKLPSCSAVLDCGAEFEATAAVLLSFWGLCGHQCIRLR